MYIVHVPSARELDPALVAPPRTVVALTIESLSKKNKTTTTTMCAVVASGPPRRRSPGAYSVKAS